MRICDNCSVDNCSNFNRHFQSLPNLPCRRWILSPSPRHLVRCAPARTRFFCAGTLGQCIKRGGPGGIPPRHTPYHYHLQKPERSRFHSFGGNLLKPGSPYSFGGTPKARQPLLLCLLLCAYKWNLGDATARLLAHTSQLKPTTRPDRILADRGFASFWVGV